MTRSDATTQFHWFMYALLTSKDRLIGLREGGTVYKAVHANILRTEANLIGFASI